MRAELAGVPLVANVSNTNPDDFLPEIPHRFPVCLISGGHDDIRSLIPRVATFAFAPPATPLVAAHPPRR